MSRGLPGVAGPSVPVSIPLVGIATGVAAWTNMPAAKTEFAGVTLHRTQADLSTASQARIVCRVNAQGVAGAKLGIQYSTDGGTNWVYLDGTADGSVGSATPQVSVASAGTIVSPWATIAGGARGDVQLRIVGSDGDGVADPTFGSIHIQVRP